MIKIVLFIFLSLVPIFAKDLKISITLVDKLPYDNKIFTQGLVYHKNTLFISGGLYGKSAIYKYDLDNRKMSKIISINSDIFSEGITIQDNKLYQLSWKKGIGSIYNLENNRKESSFFYDGEGWGISNKGKNFVCSDGSSRLKFFTYSKNLSFNTITVGDDNQQYNNLNELEWIDKYIYANVWYKDFILIISPETGEVIDKIYPKLQIPKDELVNCGVINGIAYNKGKKLLYITGKNWNYIYIFKILKN